jgi:2-methylaconitate cis-trans-isomerase PrpF
MGQTAVPAAFWRGGTSRAVLLKDSDLAAFDPRQRDRIVLAALGSPDPQGRQIDGLGGGISSLSKVCVLGWTGQEVSFTFGQVDVMRPFIDWTGTCGNMSAAVGPFAVETGWITPRTPVTQVPVIATNSGKRFIAEVPTPDGAYESEGEYCIDGVPGAGAPIMLKYLDPGGSRGMGLLPMGGPRQRIDDVEVSVVDVANPMVFVRAADLDLTGHETAAEIEARTHVMTRLEDIRSAAADRIGLHGMEAIPKIAVLASPTSEGVDIIARAVSMERIHRTFPATGAMSLAAAVVLPGTIAHELAQPSDKLARTVRIEHPAGGMDIGVELECDRGEWHVASATTFRTARKIMDGYVYVPSRYLMNEAWFDA